MSEIPKDGGPAFPRTVQNWNGHFTNVEGMSLRDWFAGQALANTGSNWSDAETRKHYARNAYKMADAMLAAREAK